MTRPDLPLTTGLRRAAGSRHPLLLALLAVALLHALGFGLLLAVVAPAHLTLGGGQAFGIGLGLTAYTLGMRHAFDADHIAAIDVATRKFLDDGRRPHAAGFFFSAGHSTVVLVLTLLLAAGLHGVAGAVRDEHSTLHQLTGTWGPAFAGLFLLLVGLLNLAILRRKLAAARPGRPGDGSALEVPGGVGPLSRVTQRLARRISAPWQLYPTGLLFGLGFDTASEVALLLLAGGGAVAGIPLPALLALPLLFAAGMTLLDTLNGAVMTRAYGWSAGAPQRRLAYSTAVTGISVLFALTIGSLSLISVAVERLQIDSGPLAQLAAVPVDTFGIWLLGLVLTTWLLAALSLRRRDQPAT